MMLNILFCKAYSVHFYVHKAISFLFFRKHPKKDFGVNGDMILEPVQTEKNNSFFS
jgi:hypothetical protein